MAHPGRGGMLWLYHTARATPSGDIRPEVVHAGVNKAVARFGAGGPRPKNVTCHGSPAKLMISASWPQDLGYSPATVASGCGEKLVFIESAGDPLSCEQVQVLCPESGDMEGFWIYRRPIFTDSVYPRR